MKEVFSEFKGTISIRERKLQFIIYARRKCTSLDVRGLGLDCLCKMEVRCILLEGGTLSFVIP